MAMPGASKIPSKMLRSFHKRPEYLQALDRVKEWTRSRFKLPEDAAILVTEVVCALPGCPPLETVVAFWTDADTRHHFKVFKPVAEVAPDDLPPAWLKTRSSPSRARVSNAAETFPARAEACATVATARATLRLADGRPNAYPERGWNWVPYSGTLVRARSSCAPMTRTIHG